MPTVHDLFDARVRLVPDALAARDAHQRVTYRELNELASRLAARLRQRGIGRDDFVAVMTEPSIDMLVATLGVVKAGAAYVALEPTLPDAILTAALQDSGARVLVTSRGALDIRRGFAGQVVALEDDDPRSRAAPAATADDVATDERLFSVVYTSGTSGHPKGVLIPERAVLNRLTWMWSDAPYRPNDVSILYRSHAAIGFTWDCFGPLLQGMPILVAPPASVRDARDLVTACVTGGVTHVSASAGRWEAILEHVAQHSIGWRTLRFARCSGEPLPASLVARWRRVFPHAVLLNVYGASECSSSAAYDTSLFSGSGRVPVGMPVPNVAIHIVDEALREVPPGSVGEVCIGGACVARGYLNQPTLTAERFPPDPFCARPGQRMFRTGDVGVFTPAAGLEIVGRRDRQVKIRGFRVELEEVEEAIRACAGVCAAAVAAEEHLPGDTRIVAYIVTSDGWEWSPARLRSLVSERVPDHMVPAAFVRLCEMPLTATGKIARALLASCALYPEPQRTTAPSTPAEEAIAEIWRSVLGVNGVDIDEDFFDLGGDSLKGMRVLSRVQGRFGIHIPLEALLDKPTIRTLAAAIESTDAAGVPDTKELPPELTAEVRRIVVSLAPAAQALSDEASLFDTDAIDSLTYLSILREIEQRYSLSLSGDDVVLADLSSIGQIAAYVAARRPANAAAAEMQRG